MSYRDILFRVEDPVAVITMNRPEKLNAFTPRMLAEIRHALGEAERDQRVVGIVLTGAGRGFCSGMDMAALEDISSGAGRRQDDLSELKASPGDPDMGPNFQVTYSYLLSIRKPILAAVNGACAGLGFVYAMLSDMRFVERHATLTTSFAQRGLIAEHGISWILPRLIGASRALDLLWSARKIDGEEAERLGLVDRLCEQDESVEQAIAYIERLAATASPTSLRLMKAQVYRHLNMPLGEAITESNAWMVESLEGPDFKEGVQSYLERRAPKFERYGSS